MKKYLFMVIALITLTVSAQEYTWFKTEIRGEGRKIHLAAFPHGEGVVYDVDGKSAQELYGLTRTAMSSYWKNPEEVIVDSREGEYIKLSGIIGYVTYSKAYGITLSGNVKATILIRFKDNKMQVTLQSLSAWHDSTQYTIGGYYPYEPILKLGKKTHDYAYEGVAIIEASMSNLVESILSQEQEDNSW